MAQPYKQTPVRLTRLDFSDKSTVLIPSDSVKPGDGIAAADATIVFHTTGGDQKIDVKVVGWKQLKDKARITIQPV